MKVFRPVRVEAEAPERMGLIGLFMRAALEERSDALDRAGISGDLGLTVAGMSATLSFEPDRVLVREGIQGKPRAHIKGSLESFVQLAKGNVTRPVLTRKVRISGNPLATLPLAKLFRDTAKGA